MHDNPNGRHMTLQYQFCGIIENHFQGDKLYKWCVVTGSIPKFYSSSAHLSNIEQLICNTQST